MAIPGKRKRGRPKISWKDAIQRDLGKYWIESERSDGQGRAAWSMKISSHTGNPIKEWAYMKGTTRGKVEEE